MRRILYTLCFFFLCVIDQRIKTCSGLDGWLETFRNLTGVVMAVLIMSHYKIQDFIKWKIPYLVWSGIGAAGGVATFIWGMDNRPFLNEWLVAIVDVILFGYIAIHVFLDIVVEKKKPELNKKFTLMWCIMMALMILSRSDYIWPVCYLVMFLSFTLTPYTEKEQEDMTQGALNGIILGFFVLQGLCFVFRPYDRVRYVGLYNNPNINALFYLEVMAAVLAKLIYTFKNNGKWWMKTYYFLGCGTVLSFLFLTIGRTAWIVVFFMVLAGLWGLWRVRGRKRFIMSGLTVVLCTCLTFPLCFGAVRYLPPLFHHPVWFFGEWADERVHSWDPWNSDKYIDLDEFADAAVGRLSSVLESILEHSPLGITAEAGNLTAEAESSEVPTAEVVAAEAVDDRYERAVYKDPNIVEDPLLTRGSIYKYYFTHLNLFGHPRSEQGFQLTPVYWIGHAHNIFLQYGTDFGIPVMILFAVLVIWACLFFRRKICTGHEASGTGWLLFIMVTALFGLLEYSWGTGSLSTFMLFFTWSKVMRWNEKAV